MSKVLKLLRDKRGATAVEYGLLVSMIAVALILALTSLGQAIANLLLNVAASF